MIEFTSGRPSFDVVHLSYHVQKRQFEKGRLAADLTPYLKDPNLTAPDLVEGDFSLGGLSVRQERQGRVALAAAGRSTTSSSTGTRRLFEKKGVALPETFDDMASLAEKLTDPNEGIYGFVGRGLRNANMTLWTNFFLNYGGEFLDAKGNIQTDGPEAIEATKLYQRLLTKPAPPGVAGFNWMESMASFTQGRAAMWIDGVGWAPPVEDPNARASSARSAMPSCRKARRVRHRRPTATASASRQASKNKEAAYLYCQWAVSKAMGARLLQTRRRRAVPRVDPQRRGRPLAASRCRPNGCSRWSARRRSASSACR